MRRVGGLTLSLVFLLAPSPAGQEETSGAHAREWRTRRWALELDSAHRELEEALRAQDWTRRSSALDAVVRGLRAGAEPPTGLARPVTAAVSDEHAVVRALALEVLRELGSGTELDPDLARARAEDLLPAVRLATARALETVPCSAAPALLGRLCLDGDERVAHAAERALFALPSEDRARAAKLAELARLAPLTQAAGNDARLLECARWLDASEPDPKLLASAVALFQNAGDERERGWLSVFTAISIGRSGVGSVEDLMDGWADDPDPSWVDPGRRALLRSAARSAREDVALTWLLSLNSEPNWEIARAILACVGPARALELGQEPTPGRRRLLTERAWQVLAPEIGTSIATWALAPAEAEVAGWLAQGAEYTLRRAAVDAFARTLARNGDPAAGNLLACALGDPDEELRTDAFLALASADDVAPHVDALAIAWRGWDAGERARAAEHLPRGVPLPAFRTDLMEQGERGGDARRVAVELLAGLAGEDEVRLLLATWLEEDLALFLSTAAREARTRELELRVQGELRALAAVDADASVEVLEAALVRSRGRSEEIGKVAAASLGRSERGRERLRVHLGPETDLRTRIEVEIQLASAGVSAALDAMLVDFPAAGWDLGVRMVRSLAACSDERSSAFLYRIARAEDEDVVLRIAALGALERRGAVAELIGVLGSARDLEVQRVALRSLGVVDRHPARRVLMRYLRSLEASDGLPGDRLPGERDLLRAEVLGALGALADPPALAEEEWLRTPLAQASLDLGDRFDGKEPQSPGFRYAGELALARGLAAAGRVGDLLARTEGWWRLDGELLLALGERTASEAGASRTLLRAAVVALDGLEGPETARRRARARFALARTTWRLRDWDAYARIAAALVRDLRASALPRAAWREALGVPDLGAGVDPLARLRASLWQARAWSAWEAGDADRARQLTREAGDRVGRSDLARTEQRRLIAAIEAR